MMLIRTATILGFALSSTTISSASDVHRRLPKNELCRCEAPFEHFYNRRSMLVAEEARFDRNLRKHAKAYPYDYSTTRFRAGYYIVDDVIVLPTDDPKCTQQDHDATEQVAQKGMFDKLFNARRSLLAAEKENAVTDTLQGIDRRVKSGGKSGKGYYDNYSKGKSMSQKSKSSKGKGKEGPSAPCYFTRGQYAKDGSKARCTTLPPVFPCEDMTLAPSSPENNITSPSPGTGSPGLSTTGRPKPTSAPSLPEEVQDKGLTCIAVIDENNAYNTESQWAQFRAAFPLRKFCLLEPNQNDTTIDDNDLYIPVDFLSNNTNFTYARVKRADDESPASDWYDICNLEAAKLDGYTYVALFIDNSGSMYNTPGVQVSLSLFENITAKNGFTIVSGVYNNNEDYISPCDSTTLLGEKNSSRI